MSSEDFVSHEALLGSICAFSAHLIFIFEEFLFAFIKFLGDDHPRSRSVTATEFLVGCVFAIIWVGVMIDGKSIPGMGLANGVTVTGIVSVWGRRVKLIC